MQELPACRVKNERGPRKDDAVRRSPLVDSPVETHNRNTPRVSWLMWNAIDTQFPRCLAPRKNYNSRLQRAESVIVPKKEKNNCAGREPHLNAKAPQKLA